uniref:Mos1 transposase HTH domain-containing protein n=1 Tax=Acanthochromis polyacanthus TaxID=80966 RepID=A0A3Q1ERN1_9TELE
MSSAQCLGELITETRTAAEQTTVKDEGRQRRLLDNIWKPQITQHTAGLPEQCVCKEEEVFVDQQLCNQERNSSPDQGDPEPPGIKEEQEELIISFDKENPGSLDIKEEQEKLCTSQEGEQLALKHEIDMLIVTPTYEEKDHSEPESNNDQFLPHNLPVAQSPDQEESKHVDSGSARNAVLRPKRRHHSSSSHNNTLDTFSENHCTKCDQKVLKPSLLQTDGAQNSHAHATNTSSDFHPCDPLQVPTGDLDLKLEQRAKIQHCVKLGKSAKETLKILQKAYGKEAMSRSRCFVWHSRFKMGRTSLDDDDRPGRPSTSTTPENVQEIEQIVCQDRRLTIKEIAYMVNMSFGTVQAILTSNLNLHRVAAKFVPRLLTPEQKQQRVKVCDNLRQQAQDDPTFTSRIITGEEIWVYDYNTETKQQSPRPKKARQVKSTTKNMLVVFFDIHGVVHREFVPHTQTVSAEIYCNILRHLRESIRQKRPKLWHDGNWVLHHDSTPAHRGLETQDLFANTNTIIIPHPPYSPDLAPCDFFLFPKMKLKLKCYHCETVEEIQNASQLVLDTLKQRDFQRAFQTWQERWERCIAAQGDYFDGDGGQI